MKLHASIADYQADIEVREEGPRVLASIDGCDYVLELQESGSGGFLLISSNQVFDCRAEGLPQSGKSIEVVVGTANYTVTLVDPKRLHGASSAGAHADGAARIIAPMPGKIVRVLVALGDQIAAGAGIVVVEAMKMQKEMKSPKAGTVVALNFEVGTTVNGGDVLAVIE